MAFNPGPTDKTHLNRTGAEAITDLILQEMPRVDSALESYLKTAACSGDVPVGAEIEGESPR
jgi:hypothetical protein